MQKDIKIDLTGWVMLHSIMRPGQDRALTILKELREKYPKSNLRVVKWVGTPVQEGLMAIRQANTSLEPAPVYTSHMNDDAFLAAFEARTIEEFHHRDHIKVAYLYLCRYPLDEAIAKVRAGLQALAAAGGAPVDNLEKGYHETMTQAWVRLVHLAMGDCGVATSADTFCDQQPQLMEKTRLQLFYSRERLMTWKAKREFVEPDLAQFAGVHNPRT